MTPQAESKLKRIDSGFYVEGYATTYEPYILCHDSNGEPIYEQILRSAFNNTDMSDVIFQFDHRGKVYARQSNGTLIVEPDEHGLFTAADLSKTTSSKQMYEEIDTELVTRMSWSFLPDYNTLEYNKETRTIIHHNIIKIFDVSAVSIPQNDATEISSRTLVDGEIEKVKQELLHRERRKAEILLKIKLGEI
ncbi:MAG: HK97 family phage prohead protease [Clostridia bacterium]|nr:HK97 family phage prohead protease [Clostridia bacterium]